ncbi:DUF2306 domain-containing protein [Gracilibacillus dipsosauri]|uniref:DUF2306 domain-containing protein n=1 Tax=Gracilibacillus dipsosauri TaxID=178340 RepID=UPI00240A50E5
MEFMFMVARWFHVLGGFLALCVFWVPIVTKKGRKTHRSSGWVYVVAMSIVSISALYMGIYRLALDPSFHAEDVPFSWFLIFIAILSGGAVWYGLRVLRYKRRRNTHKHVIDLFFPILLLTFGIAISIYGWMIDFPLLKFFPIIGVFLGGIQLQYWLSAPTRRSHWIVEHIIGMLSCCIATVTAFAVFGAPRLLQIESVSLIIWVIPILIFAPLIFGFTNYYTNKMDGKRSAS